MLLTIDIGNTRTQCGLFRGKKLIRHRDLNTNCIPEILPDISKQWQFRCTAVCSVVPALNNAVRKILPRPVIMVDHKLDLGLKIKYRNPAQVGGDRLANAVAAKVLYGFPAIVIDFGTAVTIDIIDQRGDYCGGVITAGLDMIRRGLAEKTALLPLVAIKKPARVLGKTTEGAIQSGIYCGIRGMIRQLIKDLKKELRFPKKTVIIITGGGAGALGAGMGKIDRFLTLKGLRIIYERNKRC